MCALFGVWMPSVLLASPAHAQVSGTVSLQNDDRFRGRSVSEGEPVAIVSIDYDLDTTVVVGGSVVGTTNGEGIGVSRGSGYISLAQSIGGNLAIDGGVVVQAYTDRYSSGRSQTFVEVYGGVTWNQFALHASYSPSYLDAGLETLYIEANAVQDLGAGFRANARAGVLQRLSGDGSFGGENTRWDAQIGVTKDFKHLSAFINVSTAGSGSGTYFDGPWQGRDAIVFGMTRSF